VPDSSPNRVVIESGLKCLRENDHHEIESRRDG
jgi:hypothetical protein